MNVATAAITPIAANSMNIGFAMIVAITTAPTAVTPVPIRPVNDGRCGSTAAIGAAAVGALHDGRAYGARHTTRRHGSLGCGAIEPTAEPVPPTASSRSFGASDRPRRRRIRITLAPTMR